MLADKSSRNFSYVTIGRIVSSALLAAFYLVFATILEPTDYGEMGFLIALAGTSSVISRFGLPQTLVVFKAKGNQELSNQVITLGVVTTSAASIILLFLDMYSALLCLGISFFFLYQHNLLGEKKYKSAMNHFILRGVLTFAIPFPLYFVLGIPGIILGMALGNLISAMWVVKIIRIKENPIHLIKNNYKVLVNNFGVEASSTLVRWVDKILVGAVFGFGFLGLYHFSMQVLFLVEILPRALYLFLLSEESSGKQHKKISYLVVLASCLIVVAVIVLSPIVIELFFPNYLESVFGLQILVISLIPLSFSNILNAKMQAAESIKVGYSAIVRIGSLLILLVFLGNLYGLIGFSLSVLISSILNTVFLFLLYRSSTTRKGEVTKMD